MARQVDDVASVAHADVEHPELGLCLLLVPPGLVECHVAGVADVEVIAQLLHLVHMVVGVEGPQLVLYALRLQG